MIVASPQRTLERTFSTIKFLDPTILAFWFGHRVVRSLDQVFESRVLGVHVVLVDLEDVWVGHGSACAAVRAGLSINKLRDAQ